MSQSRGLLDGKHQYKKGSIFMLPFFLLSYLISLSYILAKSHDEDSTQQTYSRVSNRYSEYGWNRNSQQCYTDPEIRLLQHINAAHKNLLGLKDDSEFFKYAEERFWYDWWHCTKPLYKDLMARLESGVFTLPSREKLDTKIFPLSNFADNMAKQIANWQRDRSENQDADRMNDPAMLMFEELKSWFLTDLTQQECRNDTLDIIAKRLSYIKTLIHLIPDLGLDKPHLIEIQRSLDHASSLIKNCIANKELPQLSSDVGRATDSFVENAFNTLHFLGINEPVTDNFSIECLRNKPNTQASPICKIYKAANRPESPALSDYQGLHQFYSIVKLNDDSPTTQVKLALRTEVANDINFASFLNEKDKLTYIEAIATLDALINVRKILDKFHHLQSKLGTYVFAINYIDKANELATHYIKLITKVRSSIKSLVTAADDGHEQILRSHDKSSKHAYFKKNLRTLETLVVAKGTTVTSQLELESALAADSMAKYQRALTKLASEVNSGYAYEELKIAMQELDLQMRYMNTVLPSMLGEATLTLNEQSGIQLVACDSNLYESCTVKLIPTTPQIFTQESLPVKATTIPAAPLNTHTSLTNLNLFAPKSSEAPPRPNALFDYGEWDTDIQHHPRTHALLFTYRLYKDGYEVGSAVFYEQPFLCLKHGRNNIIEKQGILADFHTDGMNIEETCTSLPPTLFDQVLFSAGNGALSGIRNVIGATLKTHHFTERTTFVISQTAYYGALFSIKFNDYYQKLCELNDSNNAIDALYYAAVETGQLLLINVSLTTANYLLTMIGDFFESCDWVRFGRCIKYTGSLIRFGFYAANSTSLIEAAAGIAAGATTEKLTETTGNYLLGN